MEEKKTRKYGPSTVATLKVARLGEMGAFLDAETGNLGGLEALFTPPRQGQPGLAEINARAEPQRRVGRA